MPVSAEDLYVFRHRVLREAAYQLLLPSQRAELHLCAMQQLEQVADTQVSVALARELAEHAGAALAPGSELPQSHLLQVRAAHVRLLRQWGELASQDWQNEEAALAWGALASQPDIDPYDRADALLRAQVALSQLSRYDEAAGLLAACREELAPMDDSESSTRLRCRERLAQAALHSSRAEMLPCQAAATRALELAESIGDTALIADAETSLAAAARHAGRLQEAIERDTRALALARQARGPRGVSYIQTRLGLALREAGRNEDGARVVTNAIELARSDANPRQLLSALITGATVARASDEIDRAESLLLEAMELAQRIGSRTAFAIALGNHANLLVAARNDLAGAESAQLRAVAIQREIGTPNSEAISLNNLAFTWFSVGLFAAAVRAWLAAAQLARRTDYPLLEARARCFCAVALAMLGSRQRARQEVDAGLACLQGRDEGKFFIEFGAISELTVALADLRHGDGLDRANETLQRMEALVQERGLQHDAYSRRTLDRARRLVSELSQARSQGRAPLLVRGCHPEDLTPHQRAAMLDILARQGEPPGAALKALLGAGTQNLPVPDWQDQARADRLQLPGQ